MIRTLATVLLWAAVLTATGSIVNGQSPTPDGDDVVKISTKLVQFDAVVTDREGNQVTDLKASDFDILQDGRPQKISYFSYVNTAQTSAQKPDPNSQPAKNVFIPAPTRSRPLNMRRVLTFVVDDGNCGASQIGILAARSALQKFVSEQMLPDDLVAVYQTRAGSSIFQQYTSDKVQLQRVIRRIRWYPPSGGCANSDGSFYDAARPNTFNKPAPGGTEEMQIESEDERKLREYAEDNANSNQVTGTIGVLRYAIRGLEGIGGRKVLFFMSDGLPFRGRDGRMLDAAEALRGLTEFANRTSVVFNTIDARGTFGLTAEARDDILVGANPTATEQVYRRRETTINFQLDGLAFLADETGGRFYRGQNHLDVPIGRALGLEKGYYLIGYEPDEGTFKGKKFNKVEIVVRRPELRILSRAGFIGQPDVKRRPSGRTGDAELYEALVAPLPRAGLNLQLTAFFGNSPTKGSFVRSLVHIEGDDIAFTNESDGTVKAVFDVVAVTLDQKNDVVDEFSRTHSFKTTADAVPFIKKNGLTYSTDVPVKKAGTYNYRLAIRDANSKLIGAAGQLIEVPDLKKADLHLSALSMSAVDASGKYVVPSEVKPENAISINPNPSIPSVRKFKRGTIIAYTYTIFNLKGIGNQMPGVTVKMNLYRDGVRTFDGPSQPADFQDTSDRSRVNDFGYFRLPANMEVGDHALQIIVTEKLPNGKSRSATQLVDFEVTD